MIRVRKTFCIADVAKQVGVEEKIIIECIQNEWIILADDSPDELDEEDIARILLIQNLQSNLGVNEEAVPIILNLLDQIHAMQNHLRKKRLL